MPLIVQQDEHYDPRPQAHPGLHLVALFELAKGLVSGSTAIALAAFGPQPIRDLIAQIGAWLHFDPQQSAMARLLASITPDIVHTAAFAIGIYATLRFVLFWGLWRVKAWASWFGAIAATIYLPFCSYAVWRYPGWPTVAVLALNLLIVFILVRDLYKRRVGANH